LAKDQYKNQSVHDIEEVLWVDKSVQLVRDGLNVSFKSFLLVHQLKCFQELKCDNYQLAVQALAAESKLHKLYNEMRQVQFKY
jgi:hypothetical protein